MLVIGLFIFPISSWFCLGRLCLSKNFSQVVPAGELCPNFIGILLLVVVSYDPLYLRRKRQPTPVFLPGESHRGAWWAAVCAVTKSRIRLRWPNNNNCCGISWNFTFLISNFIEQPPPTLFFLDEFGLRFNNLVNKPAFSFIDLYYCFLHLYFSDFYSDFYALSVNSGFCLFFL